MKTIGNGTKMLITKSDDLLFTLAHGEPVCPDGVYPYVLGANEAYFYARLVIKERWPEAEPVIMTSPENAYWYVEYVIKARWPEAESAIKWHETFWKWYKDEYL